MWSTGITFVEVEQGHPPFQIETEFRLLHEILQTVGGVGRRVKNSEVCTKLVKQSARKWGETHAIGASSRHWWTACLFLILMIEFHLVQQHSAVLLGGVACIRLQALFSPHEHHSTPIRWQAPLSHHSGYRSGVQPSR